MEDAGIDDPLDELVVGRAGIEPGLRVTPPLFVSRAG